MIRDTGGRMEHDWEPDNGSSGIKREVSETARDESGLVSGGAEGIRTPDPLLAKQVLSQLSYGPTMEFDRPQYIVDAHLACLGRNPSRVSRAA